MDPGFKTKTIWKNKAMKQEIWNMDNVNMEFFRHNPSCPKKI